MNGFQYKVSFIWSVADLLRGDYKPSEYGRVILPLVLLRRLDCVLAPTKDAVLAEYSNLYGRLQNLDPVLNRIAKQRFHNTSKLDFPKLLADPNNIAGNLRSYINAFSPQARDTFEKFDFDGHITRLDQAGLLYLVIGKFCEIDLHPDVVSNLEMGYIFEELIRRFSEQANETAGEHFTPREVIRLMVDVLFIQDDKELVQKGIVRTLYDPTCGTGGMLSVGEEYLRELNPAARLEVFGQELNDETYAICQSDMMLKGYDPSNIKPGNSFTKDGFAGKHFDYFLANPPYGVEWKKVETFIRNEQEKSGYEGRFGAGLPRINDGSFLFLQHMVSKWKSVEDGGSRLGIVLNGSPLFTGGPGSGESEIRRWIIENDWLEALIALPDQLFYNTGINTYVWVLTNRKAAERQGKVQLINAVSMYRKMRKSLGNKRNEIGPDQIDEIVRIYGDFAEGPYCKIFNNEDFGYRRITVERPLRQRYEVNHDTIALVMANKTVQKFLATPPNGSLFASISDDKRMHDLFEYSLGIVGGDKWNDAETAAEIVDRVLARANIKPTPAVRKAIVEGLAVRNEYAPIVRDKKGNVLPDAELRDSEDVPLTEDINAYFECEVIPHVPDAWINMAVIDPKDNQVGKVGYEINFNRYFYQYQPPRPLKEIDAELKVLEQEIAEMLREVTA